VGGCGGTWTGNPYVTGPITGDCTVTATFAIDTFTVTPSAGAGGSISPSTPQTVNYNATTSFTVTANTGYHTVSVIGCGGSWTGNPYVTGPITGDCTVTASFAVDPLTITTSSPLPSGSLGVVYNQTLAATGGLTPYTWSITSGSLPNGLNINSSPSGISGTPTATGTSYFNVTVTDDNSSTFTKNFSITIQSFNCRILRTLEYFSAIHAAYDYCWDDDTIQCQAVALSGDVLCDTLNKPVTLKGGYDANFTSNTGYTTINGRMIISNGTVTVENIIIK
jgi:hypothetical protein